MTRQDTEEVGIRTPLPKGMEVKKSLHDIVVVLSLMEPMGMICGI